MVESWRRTVPDSFTFSVRCHQGLTRDIGLKPTNEVYEIFYQMRAYCDALRSDFLLLETPAFYVIDSGSVKDAIDFLSTLNLKGVRLVWAYRAPITSTVISLMQE